MKHFSALTMLANSDSKYGLIAEDDIIENQDYTIDKFDQLYSEIILKNADYVDLAGGCNLHADLAETNNDNQLVSVNPPRTRSNAAYIVSNRLAKILVNKFFPASMPIDWHITYLMYTQMTQSIDTYWCRTHPLIHGSEVGAYTSWRQ